MNKFESLEIQNAIREFVLSTHPTLFVTHNFGGHYKADTQINRMRGFYSAMQRYEFGRDWAAQTDRPWPKAFGFREHPNSNSHYHVMVAACPRLTKAIINDGPGIWQKMARNGQLKVELPHSTTATTLYSTKDLIHEQAFDDIFIYSDTRRGCP